MKLVRANWRTAILVCGKCSKKIGGGFGPKGKTSLTKALRTEARLKKGRKAAAGIVEVGCLKVCPRYAVTVVDAARPETWMVVEAGADVGQVAERLGLGHARAEEEERRY